MIRGVSEASNPRRSFTCAAGTGLQLHEKPDTNQRQHLEVKFYDNFCVAPGLLTSIQKEIVIKINQSPIGEGLWMQTATEQHMNMRFIVT